MVSGRVVELARAQRQEELTVRVLALAGRMSSAKRTRPVGGGSTPREMACDRVTSSDSVR
eukprot:4832046-Prymnesium_polylepis.1